MPQRGKLPRAGTPKGICRSQKKGGSRKPREKALHRAPEGKLTAGGKKKVEDSGSGGRITRGFTQKKKGRRTFKLKKGPEKRGHLGVESKWYEGKEEVVSEKKDKDGSRK